MRFPPPARYYAPALVLVFGLAVAWFNFELNLANDLMRNLDDIADQTEATAARLVKLAERTDGNREALAEDLAATAATPWLSLAAMVDAQGTVVADSDQKWAGRPATATPLAPAMKLAGLDGTKAERQETRRMDEAFVLGAYPVTHGGQPAGWILVIFDRSDAVSQARTDAYRQLRWEASAIAVLGFCLWAALHFGLTTRLARLTHAVHEFGEGHTAPVAEIPGGDEVHELSAAFASMGARLAAREAERVRLEREIFEASEKERRRIGQDLHDGVGQQLTAASLSASALSAALDSTTSDLAPQAENLGRQIRETMAAIRTLSHGLAPLGSEDEALAHALRALVDSTSRNTAVRCVFEYPEPIRALDTAKAAQLYRIAQEAVNNALKHASPTEIRLGLERCEDGLLLEVDDDGEGLPETLAAGDGIGLQVMRHRAQLAGGTLEIGSPPAGGTRIACRIPLPT